RPGRRVQAKDLRRLELRVRGGVAAGMHTAAGDGRRRIDVQSLKMPDGLAAGGVEAVKTVVAGADEHAAVGDRRAGLGVAGGGERPEFLTRGGVEAVDLAARVFVGAFAEVEPAAVEAGRAKHRLEV